MLKRIINAIRPNPFDMLLKQVSQEDKNRFLIVWNRGLGDVPLGLYALVHRINSYIPHASITFLTRKDLAQACQLIDGIKILVDERWERGKPVNIEKSLKNHDLSTNMFDVVLEKPNPTKWLKWQLKTLVPKLKYKKEWDDLTEKYKLDPNETYIGCHIQTETENFYDYEKNWDLASWRDLFKRISQEKKGKVLLFGMNKNPAFLMDDVIDLRGQTNLIEMISLIKNRCCYLVAPDSGVLSISFYIDIEYPIHVVSLWSDSKQGILRQGVHSPNSQYKHVPLRGKNSNVTNISVSQVYKSLFYHA